MAQNLIKVPDILATGRYKLTGESLLMLIILVNFELSLGNIWKYNRSEFSVSIDEVFERLGLVRFNFNVRCTINEINACIFEDVHGELDGLKSRYAKWWVYLGDNGEIIFKKNIPSVFLDAYTISEHLPDIISKNAVELPETMKFDYNTIQTLSLEDVCCARIFLLTTQSKWKWIIPFTLSRVAHILGTELQNDREFYENIMAPAISKIENVAKIKIPHDIFNTVDSKESIMKSRIGIPGMHGRTDTQRFREYYESIKQIHFLLKKKPVCNKSRYIRSEYKELWIPSWITRKHYIYLIKNEENGKHYVWKSDNFPSLRWAAHLTGNMELSAFSEDVKKYGILSFSYRILEEIEIDIACPQKERNQIVTLYEQRWMDKYNGLTHWYNRTRSASFYRTQDNGFIPNKNEHDNSEN